MGLLQRLFGSGSPRADAGPFVVDPVVLETLRGGGWLFGDGEVNVEQAMRNPTMFRCVTLISSTIGMLPLHLIDKDTKEKASDHPLFKLLHSEPNAWQTAYEFRSLMQMRVLTKGNAYALIIWSRDAASGTRKPTRLLPLDPDRVTAKLNDAWEIVYEYQPAQGAKRLLNATDVLHLRGFSFDGITGVSLIRQARDAIRLAIDADLAVRRLFQNGSFVGATLETPNELTPEAYDRLVASWNEQYAGARNAGKTPLLEGGTKFVVQGTSAKDAQSHELRGRQIEEIARVSGVPRPLLMMDETSWGSGIDALGQFFVQYGLNPWFEAWQQAIGRSLLAGADKDRFVVRFNPGALLRGSMKDQGEYLAKALGAGGHQPWMTVEEVRDVLDMPKRDVPPNPMAGHNGGPPLGEGE